MILRIVSFMPIFLRWPLPVTHLMYLSASAYLVKSLSIIHLAKESIQFIVCEFTYSDAGYQLINIWACILISFRLDHKRNDGWIGIHVVRVATLPSVRPWTSSHISSQGSTWTLWTTSFSNILCGNAHLGSLPHIFWCSQFNWHHVHPSSQSLGKFVLSLGEGWPWREHLPASDAHVTWLSRGSEAVRLNQLLRNLSISFFHTILISDS